MTRATTQRVVILGAAGRDFHNFNVHFRGHPETQVVAFTAAQIPNIEGRRYPPELAGPGYPDGIPIEPEAELERIIREQQVDVAVFSYSDVSHQHVMALAGRAMAAGADFLLLGPKHTMLQARVPVVAVCAMRTGAGKSQTSRRVVQILRERGKRVVAVRHPMPYGDLRAQAVQRFASWEDLDRYQVTIEEREEYEPYIRHGHVIYAGVDYEAILRQAEQEAEILIWDGGNNDLPFYRPDLHIVVVDPLRAEHAATYFPSPANMRLADLFVINKVDTASFQEVERARSLCREMNPQARVVEAASPFFLEDGQAIQGKRVLVVEDGPTLTHGEMAFGAGWLAARRYGAAEILDPRPYAVGSIRETFAKWPQTGAVLPAMGYGPQQIAELAETIRQAPADLVIVATPIDLRRLMELDKPALRVRYELQEIGEPTLDDLLGQWLASLETGEGGGG